MNLSREQSVFIHQLLVRAYECDKKIEIARKTLMTERFFEPYNLFKNLDLERKSFIVSDDVQRLIGKLYPEFPWKSVDYAFSVMSRGLRKMDFDTFAQQIIPLDYGKPYKTIYFENKSSLELTPELSLNVQIDFANLVRTIHDENLAIDHIVKKLQSLAVTGREFYFALARDDKGYLSTEDLQRVLKAYFHYVGTLR